VNAMSGDSYDILRRAVVEALGARPSPERRRQVAADLRALAEQQERMAARDEQAASGEPAAVRARARAPGMYVRVSLEPDALTGAPRLRLSFGRQIWLEFGAPERIALQPTAGELWIVEAKGKSGYPVSTAGSLPSCLVDVAGPASRLAPGRYAAHIRAGALVVGERIG